MRPRLSGRDRAATLPKSEDTKVCAETALLQANTWRREVPPTIEESDLRNSHPSQTCRHHLCVRMVRDARSGKALGNGRIAGIDAKPVSVYSASETTKRRRARHYLASPQPDPAGGRPGASRAFRPSLVYFNDLPHPLPRTVASWATVHMSGSASDAGNSMCCGVWGPLRPFEQSGRRLAAKGGPSKCCGMPVSARSLTAIVVIATMNSNAGCPTAMSL
jgi:hypothetical protein